MQIRIQTLSFFITAQFLLGFTGTFFFSQVTFHIVFLQQAVYLCILLWFCWVFFQNAKLETTIRVLDEPKGNEKEAIKRIYSFFSSFKSDIELYLTGTIPCMIHIPVRPLPGTDSRDKFMTQENIFLSLFKNSDTFLTPCTCRTLVVDQ